MRCRYAVKIYQTITIMPSFLSWVVVGYMAYAVLETQKGMLNKIIAFFGGDAVQWYASPQYWPIILLLVSLWYGVGNGSVFYFASLMGIEKDYFEAAELDGATKLQVFKYILLPFLTTLIIIITILNIGKIFRSDFGLFLM